MKCNYGRGISVTKMEDPSMLHKHSLFFVDNRRSEMGAFFMLKIFMGKKVGFMGFMGFKKLSLHLIRF